MIPLRDTIPSRTVPFVTHLLLAVNVAAFLVQVAQGARLDLFVERWAFVPAKLFTPSLYGGGTLPAAALTLVTSMFLHGGLLHLGGNLLYLWIFADNVEDVLGHGRFLAFYLACGVAAALLQGALSPASTIPTLGASGAIAGVLGAYFVLFPRARVVTIVPLFVLFPLVEVPAGLYLLFWFLFQFWMGGRSLATGAAGAAQGGVAWWAHVGGFVAGLLFLLVLRPRRRASARVLVR